MLRAVLFDAVGTLIYLPRSVGKHYAEVGRRFGLRIEPLEFDRAFRRAWKAAPARKTSAGPRADDDRGWWRDLVGQILRDLEADPPPGYFEALYSHFAEPGVWEAYPETTAVLDGVRSRGLKLAIVSNFDGRLRAILQHLQLADFFDALAISSEVGADKPDPRIFQCALEMLEISANDAVHVGDEPKLDGGAQTAGIRVLHLQRPAMTLETCLRDVLS